MTEKSFVYLYPEERIFREEIEKGVRLSGNDYSVDSFRRVYSSKLNYCIDVRYRRKGFSVNYVILDDSEVSDVISLRSSDRVVRAGMDTKTHTTKRDDGTYSYPDQDFILDQLEDPIKLAVGGFHMWDCVGKLASRAYERGMNVLVDEDLTEFFIGRLDKDYFRPDIYPTYDPRKRLGAYFEAFMEAREDKPWFWQDY